MRDDSGDVHSTPRGVNPTDRFPGHDGMPLAVLRRSVRGESTTGERRRVDAWAAADPERQRYLDSLRRLRARAPADGGAHTDAAWRRLASHLEMPSRARTPGRPATRRAILVAAFGTMAVLGATLHRRTAPVRPSPAAAPVMRLIATTKGQRAEIRLSDGSNVTLGVDSRLRFAANFGVQARDLYLEGSAYFNVVHDSTRPFRIHTATAVTEDIGTRFVVTAYPETHSTTVVVTAGRVSLRPAHTVAVPTVNLTSGDLGRVTANVRVPEVRAVDTTTYTAWMQGRLVFHDTPLVDVVAELRRWYDVDMRIGSPKLARIPLSASFTVESFDQAVKVVTTVLPLRAVRRGNVVTLYDR
ncbi:MAG: FecR family protein [Gemmatimonadaceae bacterium]